MRRPTHIPQDAIDRNRPAMAHTHGLPWVSRAAWIAFSQMPSSTAAGAAAVKLVLWDLVYIDGSTTRHADIAARCNLPRSKVTAALILLHEAGLVECEQRVGGRSYSVRYEAVAALDRVRAPRN